MNIKKIFGLLMVLTIAIFAFTACSSDDDEKTNTFVYAVGYPSLQGDFVGGMQKVNDAFKQAFGVTGQTLTLIGTRSECNRKAKEYAMKAQAALAKEGSFGAIVQLANVTTDELIYTFTIKADDNAPLGPQKFEILDNKFILYGMKGYTVQITEFGGVGRRAQRKIVFDGVVSSQKETIGWLLNVGWSYDVKVYYEDGSYWTSFGVYKYEGHDYRFWI